MTRTKSGGADRFRRALGGKGVGLEDGKAQDATKLPADGEVGGAEDGVGAEGVGAAPGGLQSSLPAPGSQKKGRGGKIMIGGHFTPELSKAVKMLAIERDVTVQHLVGEALDLLMREHLKHPFGER